MGSTYDLSLTGTFADGSSLNGYLSVEFDSLRAGGLLSAGVPSTSEYMTKLPDGSYEIYQSASRAFAFVTVALFFADANSTLFTSGYRETGYWNVWANETTIYSKTDLTSSAIQFTPTYLTNRSGGYFVVDGSQGTQTLFGAAVPSFIDTSAAYGTGTVLVDLRDGYVSRGGVEDAILNRIPGVQLGADPSVVIGLSSATDLIYGGTGDAQFYGEGATDDIRGGTGTNEIVGGSGTEVFYGGGGTDTMLGGSGQNFMQAGPTASSVDIFYGGGGLDWVYGGPGTTELIGGSGFETLTGGAGYNELIGSGASPGVNVFYGGSGTDVFYAGMATNLFYEANGTDFFQGQTGTDIIYGGSGNSFIYGGSGTDVITAGAGNQHVQAGSGHTYFNDTAANLTGGRFDQIDNFAGGQGTELYLPASVQGTTNFVQVNGGTAVLTATSGGIAEILAGGADAATVQAHTHFTL